MAWSEELHPWQQLHADSPYLNEVKQAIDALYKHPDKEIRSQAETWLLQQQGLLISWQAGWTLLQFDKTVEEQYFGAHFIHHKISQCWSSIGVEHFQNLLQVLFQKLIDYRKGPSIVRTKLCVAVAAFALQAMMGSWPGAITHTINYLTQHNSRDIALQVLVLIPEEFTSIAFTSQSKSSLRVKAKESVPDVVKFISDSISDPNHNEMCLKVFNSWITFDLPVEESQSLIDKMFEDIHSKQHQRFELICDCMVNFLRQPTTINYPNTVWNIISKVVGLQSILGEAIQVDDMELCQGLCQILLAITETYTKLLLNTSRNDRISQVSCIILMILECTGVTGSFPVDETFSDTTLQFWFNFGDDIVSEEPDHTKRLLEMYTTVFLKLVDVLTRKIMYPSDNAWSSWSDDNKTEFENYRKEVGDTVLYIQSFVPQCMAVLQFQYSTCQNADTTWQKIEAILFMFRSIAETVYEGENSDKTSATIATVIESLPSLPSHPKISRTALLLCGAYSEWLRNHPDKLLPAVKVLISNINDVTLAPAAVQAFRDLCMECTDVLATEINALIEPFVAVYHNPLIKNREKIRLCWSLCTLCSQVPQQTLQSCLGAILGNSCTKLKILASREQADPKEQSEVKLELGMINSAFHALSVPPSEGADSVPPSTGGGPLLSLLQEVWEPLKVILVLWSNDEVIIDDLTKCYWNAINSLGKLFDPYITTLVDMLCQCYEKNQYACLLENSAQGLFNIYSQDKPDLIAGMLQRLSNTTFTLFTKTMSEHPDIVQAFFSLHLSALRTQPQIVYRGESNCRAVLRAALAAITMQEYHTVKQVSRWLTEFVGHYTKSNEVEEAIRSQFQFFISELIRGVGTAAPSSTVEFLGDVFIPLTRVCPEQLRSTLLQSMSIEHFPTRHVSLKEKETFVNSVMRDCHHKRRLKTTIKEFSLMCRGYRHTSGR